MTTAAQRATRVEVLAQRNELDVKTGVCDTCTMGAIIRRVLRAYQEHRMNNLRVFRAGPRFESHLPDQLKRMG